MAYVFMRNPTRLDDSHERGTKEKALWHMLS